MSLLTLPPEVLSIIIRKLDTKSMYNLYAAGVVCIQGLVTECRLSANTLATAITLKTDFFTGVSGYLKVLNLCGVPDLDLPCLLDGLTNMKCLVDLDVSYTNINMSNFLEIAAARPTLTSIAIDFTFVERNKAHIMDEALLEVRNMLPRYQLAFQRFENVHFVGRLHARVHGMLALLVLARAALSNLTFTTIGAVEGSRLDISKWPAMSVTAARFQLYYLKMPYRRSLLETPIFTMTDFKKYEAIIFCEYREKFEFGRGKIQTVLATPLLKEIICKHFSVEIESLSAPISHSDLAAKLATVRLAADRLRSSAQGADFACLFWDAERTAFDRAFSSKLLKIFREYFVFIIDDSATPVPNNHDWCCVKVGSHVLDYETKFQAKEHVKLKIIFDKTSEQNTMPKIVNNSNFLRKITYLSLYGWVPGDADYFKGLFTSCCHLETLQLSLKRTQPTITFLKHLKEAKRLKNFFINYHPKQTCPLLTYLCECNSLENIIVFTIRENKMDLIPLLSKLNNVYNFYVHLSRTASKENIEDMCNRITSTIGRAALRVNLLQGFKLDSYHPYLSVFNLMYNLHPTHGYNVLKI